MQNGRDLADSQYGPGAMTDYWDYARRYSLADHFFSTIASNSFPNHLVLVAGSSLGVVDNPSFRSGSTSPTVWGCDSPKWQTVAVYARGRTTEQHPCLIPALLLTRPMQLVLAGSTMLPRRVSGATTGLRSMP